MRTRDFLLFSSLLAAAPVFGQTLEYDASLGTLPSGQGWIHFVDDPPPIDGLTEANYTVAAGVQQHARGEWPRHDTGSDLGLELRRQLVHRE